MKVFSLCGGLQFHRQRVRNTQVIQINLVASDFFSSPRSASEEDVRNLVVVTVRRANSDDGIGKKMTQI